MVLRESAVAAVLVGAALAAVDYAPSYLPRWVLDNPVGWLPRFATDAQTITFYIYVSRGTAFVLGIGCVFALGYWAGSRFDFRAQFRSFVLAVGLGGLVGYGIATLVYALAVVFVLENVRFSGPAAFDGALGASRTVAVAVQFAVVGFAGAAFADVAGASVERSDEGGVSADRVD